MTTDPSETTERRNMANEPRKHHSTPRSVLRNFTINSDGRRLFVFDKQERRSFVASVDDAGAERDFNRVQVGDRDLNYESLFQELDDRLAMVVNRLVQEMSVANLETDELRDLPTLVACQLVRTKLQRTTTVEISRQLAERIKELGLAEPRPISDADARRIALKQLFRLDEYAVPISEKDIILLISRQQQLLTSDNPVVVYNTFPYGQTGLKSPGVELYYPLAPHLCLALYCPSIREILGEAIDPNHPRPRPTDPFMFELYNALVGQRTLEIPEEYSTYLNTLQISQSSRFLYSNRDEFGLAHRILSQDPKVANVKTRFSLGTSVVPHAPDLPAGTWLVAEKGHRHYSLQIELVNNESGFIDFRTTDVAKLDVMEQDIPFDSVTVYQDGHGIRGIRGAVLRLIEQGEIHFVRVQHDDPGLNAILAKYT